MHQILLNIKALRKSQKLSQEEISAKLGITQSSYARFENESVKIDYRLIEKVAEVFRITVIQIINFHQVEETQQVMALNIREENFLQQINSLKELNIELRKQLADKDRIIALLSES